MSTISSSIREWQQKMTRDKKKKKMKELLSASMQLTYAPLMEAWPFGRERLANIKQVVLHVRHETPRIGRRYKEQREDAVDSWPKERELASGKGISLCDECRARLWLFTCSGRLSNGRPCPLAQVEHISIKWAASTSSSSLRRLTIICNYQFITLLSFAFFVIIVLTWFMCLFLCKWSGRLSITFHLNHNLKVHANCNSSSMNALREYAASKRISCSDSWKYTCCCISWLTCVSCQSGPCR